MKKLSIIALALLLSSCGYSVQSESEARTQQYRVEALEEQFDQVKLEMEAEKDSMRVRLERSNLALERYKDSVAFMELTRIMCYTSGEHRHSCNSFKQ